MKKVVKKSLALFMSLAMVLGAVVVASPVTAQADDGYNAYLMFADSSWQWDNWSADVANTTVTSDGTYTVTLNASDAADKNTDAATGAVVFCVDIVGINNADVSLDDIHIYTDGEEISVDASKVLTGDIEDKGNYRIEIYNEYGSGTASDSPIDTSSFTWSESLVVTFTISNTGLTSDESSDDTASVSYNAYLMFADSSWQWDNWSADVANTTVTGDGTYTVTLNASDAADKNTDAASGAVVFCVDIVGINNTEISLDDIHVYTDGTEISVDATKVLTGDIEENGNYRIEIYNEYGSTASDSPIDTSSFTWSDSLSVTFTISNVTASDDSDEDTSGDSDEDTSGTSDDSDSDTSDDSDSDTSDEETEDVTVTVNEGVSYNTSYVLNLDADENMRSITITISPLYYNEWPDGASWNDYAVAWIYVMDGDTETVYGIASGAGANYTVEGTTTTGYEFTDVPITYFMYGDAIEITIPLSGEAATIEIGTGSWDSAPDDVFIMVDQYVLSSTVVETSTGDDSDSDDSDSSSSSSSSSSVSSTYVSEAVSALEEEFSSVSSLEAVYSASGVTFTEVSTDDGYYILLEDESFVAGTTYYIAISYDEAGTVEYLEVLCTEDGVLEIYPEASGVSSDDTMTIVVAAESADDDDDSTTTTTSPDTSDAAPYASTLVLLAGAALVVIFRKRVA